MAISRLGSTNATHHIFFCGNLKLRRQLAKHEPHHLDQLSEVLLITDGIAKVHWSFASLLYDRVKLVISDILLLRMSLFYTC